jgi:hypothetical protein
MHCSLLLVGTSMITEVCGISLVNLVIVDLLCLAIIIVVIFFMSVLLIVSDATDRLLPKYVIVM